MTRAWLLAALFLLAATDAKSAPTEKQATDFLDRWVATQNAGDADEYQALYAKDFVGVRRSGKKATTFDRAGWIADRAKMFKQPMQVEATGATVTAAADKATVRFTQTWASGTYRDTGTKELVLVLDGANVRIAREEMLDSKVLPRVLLTWILTPAGGENSTDVTLEVSGSVKRTYTNGAFDGCRAPEAAGVLASGKTSSVKCREGDEYEDFWVESTGKNLKIGETSGSADTGEAADKTLETLSIPPGADVFVEVELRAPETP